MEDRPSEQKVVTQTDIEKIDTTENIKKDWKYKVTHVGIVIHCCY